MFSGRLFNFFMELCSCFWLHSGYRLRGRVRTNSNRVVVDAMFLLELSESIFCCLDRAFVVYFVCVRGMSVLGYQFR